ncbi:MAG: glycoside hydrolase family 43 protein [Firmicutes bacterium]|nr:glycoside hydrolase family 43 protein [Bacillota bacterium]
MKAGEKLLLSLIAFGVLIFAVTACGGREYKIYPNEPQEHLTLLTEQEASALFYTNPVGVVQIGDPFVLLSDDGYFYMYATSGGGSFTGWRSPDMVNWTRLGVVFQPPRDHWGMADYWAPEVLFHNGRYYMFYSARWRENGSLRIGVAVSDSPAGPFVDALDRPLFDFGWAAIDGHSFIDDCGTVYLYFSRDCSENVINGIHESHIYVVTLSDDLLSVTSDPIFLLAPTQSWEARGTWRWNEGPWVIKHEGIYYLMYSANYFASREYSVGYATSDNPLGPFVKHDLNPILHAQAGWTHVSGPGHHSVVRSRDGRELFAVYHTHTNPANPSGNRQVQIDRMGFRSDGTLFINGPTASPMPMPSTEDGFRNIAMEAAVEASSARHREQFIIDGAIGIDPRHNHYDWISDDRGPQTITLRWDRPFEITAVMAFPGVGMQAVPLRVRVNSVGGAGMEEIIEPPIIPGAAAIAAFEPRAADYVTITVYPHRDNIPVRLSEIFVLGREI